MVRAGPKTTQAPIKASNNIFMLCLLPK
jgi:hypothetical protein